MNLRRQVIATAATILAVGGLAFGAAAPASAITRAYPCNGNDTGGYLEFYSNNSACFTGRGSQNVELYNVTDVNGGDDQSYFYDNTTGTLWSIGPWTYIPGSSDWYPGHNITWVCMETYLSQC